MCSEGRGVIPRILGGALMQDGTRNISVQRRMQQKQSVYSIIDELRMVKAAVYLLKLGIYNTLDTFSKETFNVPT